MLSPGCPSGPRGQCTATADCVYPDGEYCNCAPDSAPECLPALVLPEPCPSQIPNAGETCSLPAATTCMASYCGGQCGFSVVCWDGVWSWIQDCSCQGHVCASPDTPITTPDGERRIADLRIGDAVYTVDHDSIRAVPIIGIRRQRVEDHHVVRIATSDGRTLEISAPHPTADGRVFGDLHAGDSLDGRAIESIEVIGYTHEFTYDILPGSDTGTYFAAGMQIGSTLYRGAKRFEDFARETAPPRIFK
jgi:hypothetical protein